MATQKPAVPSGAAGGCAFFLALGKRGGVWPTTDPSFIWCRPSTKLILSVTTSRRFASTITDPLRRSADTPLPWNR